MSGFRSWDQREHADMWILYGYNVGAHLSIDEVALTNGELYTIVTNKAAHGKSGALIAIVKGTKVSDVATVVSRIDAVTRNTVTEVTLDMSPAMEAIAQQSFPKARLVTDRFHVQQLVSDAVQEVLACSLVAYVKLYERGRAHLAFPSVLVRYAVAQFHCGRRVGTPSNSRDLFSPLASHRRGVYVNELDQHGNAVDWRDVIVENRNSTPADIAAFRIDFAAWLSRLSRRKRGIARMLAAGETTTVTARRFRISAGRVSQIRRELEESWREYQGESAVDETAASKS